MQSIEPQPFSRPKLGEIPEPFRSSLNSMYSDEPQLGADGQLHEMNVPNQHCSIDQCLFLYRFTREHQPISIAEIGMAFGYSSLCFLAAISENGHGSLTSIDPYQDKNRWCGIGRTHAERAVESVGLDPNTFEFVEERSDRAAVDLARSGRTFDLIYIDGAHRFDDALVDFYHFDQICDLGGHIIFDDLWMDSIQSVVSFLKTNRPDYELVPTPLRNVRVFRRIAADKRDWDQFESFNATGAPMLMRWATSIRRRVSGVSAGKRSK